MMALMSLDGKVKWEVRSAKCEVRSGKWEVRSWKKLTINPVLSRAKRSIRHIGPYFAILGLQYELRTLHFPVRFTVQAH
jgi:hypothetical protein